MPRTNSSRGIPVPGRTEGGYICESAGEVDILGGGGDDGYEGKEGKILHLGR